MKILIDGYWLEKPRGLGTYSRALVSALSRDTFSDFSYIVLAPIACSKLQLPISDRIQYEFVDFASYPIWENFVVPNAVNRLKPRLLHCPNNTRPLVPINCRCVVTIHDLIFFDSLGSSTYQRIGNLYRRLIAWRVKFSNDHVVTVSKTSSDTIRRRLNKDAQFTYTPPDLSHFHTSKQPRTTERYFVHIGGEAAHKNSRKLIDAFLEAQVDARLYVLGVSSDSRLASSFSSSTAVVFPGWVTDVEKSELLGGSLGVLFPSLAEGFGLPIIEGFAAGTPVVTSNRQPMMEVGGKGALYINPESREEMILAIRQLALSPSVRDELIAKGSLELPRFTESAFLRDIISFYTFLLSK